MRYVLIVLLTLLWSVTSAIAQVSIGIGLPGVNIGINLGGYPQLVQVPGYPVYYAPQMDSNYFFYDGMYWVYEQDNWYASTWYNGPWGVVGPEYVPLYILRVPVSYYRQPPGYFRGWRSNAPPRWDEHWGNDWSQRRSGWNKWDRASAPRPAPLPTYQRQYSGDRYPRVEQQQELRARNYSYQPRDTVVRQHFQEQAPQRTSAPSQRDQKGASQDRNPGRQDTQRSSPPAPVQQSGRAEQRPQPQQRGGEDDRKSSPTQAAPPQQRGPAAQEQRQQPQQGAAQRESPAPRSSADNNPQGKGASPEQRRGREQEKKDREKGDERGQERNK